MWLGHTQLPASVLFSGKQLYLDVFFLLPQNGLEDRLEMYVGALGAKLLRARIITVG